MSQVSDTREGQKGTYGTGDEGLLHIYLCSLFKSCENICVLRQIIMEGSVPFASPWRQKGEAMIEPTLGEMELDEP